MKFLLSGIFLAVALSGFSQKHELGLSIGATNYKGDFTNDNFEVKNYRPSLLLFYKNNITPAFGLRYHILGGILMANDATSSDAVYESRDLSFSKPFLEGALQLEYNFLNYRSTTNRFRWTPYFLGGIGVAYVPDGQLVTPCIPIGVGLRFIVKENWNIGLEAAARKLFTDKLDGVSDNDYAGNGATSDWYLYNGFTISYTFYDVYCPRPKR